MAIDGTPTPRFEDLESRSHDLLSQLGQLYEGLGKELATAHDQLRQADALQKTTAQEFAGFREKLARAEAHWAAERKSLRETQEARVKELNDRIAALSADNESLQTFQLQWAAEREEHVKARKVAETTRGELEQQLRDLSNEHSNLKQLHGGVTEQWAADRVEHDRARKAAESRQAELEQQLRDLSDDHSKLKELHTGVTEQARTLAGEWNARRQSLAADTQRLRLELEQVGKALELSKQREKQWQAQVYKLQDELRNLRETTSRMTLTDDQSHHLLSQLNAIIGFAEVLLDEAGSRATGQEREEFLHDIKESGTHLADYVNQLTATTKAGETPVEPGDRSALAPPTPDTAGRTILVAATDAGIRDRTRDFLDKPGYQVEFAGDAAEAMKLAVQLQPLAVMIDTELPPDGPQPLIDALAREPRTRDIPVVLAGTNDKQLFSLMVDRFDLLTKPINRQQLLQLMVKYDLLADRRRTTKMPTTVLVIDDDARNTRLVKAMLKPHTVNVLQADGGAAGIKLALKHKPDLIILDLMMPDVDGYQVVSELRNDPSTSQIPILIYTAKNITADDRGRLRDSVQTIVRKGEMNKEQFLELVYRRGERRNQPADSQAAA